MSTASILSNPEHYEFEFVPCYHCGGASHRDFIVGHDDLTGKPGTFRFVRCEGCGLVLQNPRLTLEQIKGFYDEEYIAHRKKTDWGLMTRFYNYVMGKHDRDKAAMVSRYVKLSAHSAVLDVGCAVGTFLNHLKGRYRCKTAGVDFKDLGQHPCLRGSEFFCGLFSDAPFPEHSFDLITMWHFLEHDYDPKATLQKAKALLRPQGRLVIEVPRLDSLTFRLFAERWPGLQAPQHTVLFDRQRLIEFVEANGYEVVDYLPYGAFPAYFYLFAGVLFKIKKGGRLDLGKLILPYFLGQILLVPILAFERRLNVAMQTVVVKVKDSPV